MTQSKQGKGIGRKRTKYHHTSPPPTNNNNNNNTDKGNNNNKKNTGTIKNINTKNHKENNSRFHHRQQPYSNNNGPSPTKRTTPSKEALEFSSVLKDYSSKKMLREALEYYHHPSKDDLRDVHHGSIVVDCCARCGDFHEAERVVLDMHTTLSRKKKGDGVLLLTPPASAADNDIDIDKKKKDENSMGIHIYRGGGVPVQAHTALMKAYAHAGKMERAMTLYRQMFHLQNKKERPNIRTFNTLLRGCMWTASTQYSIHDDHQSNTTLAGGIVSAQEAWNLSSSIIPFDASSYEYSIVILCQALRCQEAEQRLIQMMQTLGIKFEYPKQPLSQPQQNKQLPPKDGESVHTDSYNNNNNPYVYNFPIHDLGKEENNDDIEGGLESVASALVCLARAHALLGQTEKAMGKTISASNILQRLVVDNNNNNTSQSLFSGSNLTSHRKMVAGGKRSWKQISSSHQKNDETHTIHPNSNRREVSNSIFRKHRLGELKSEINTIQSICSFSNNDNKKNGRNPSFTLKKSGMLAKIILTRLLYFSGGGTTGMEAITEKYDQKEGNICLSLDNDNEIKEEKVKSIRSNLIETLWMSFGLAASVGRNCDLDGIIKINNTELRALKKKDHASIRNHIGQAEYSKSVLNNNGCLDFSSVFRPIEETQGEQAKDRNIESSDEQHLHIELGAGSGEWITNQAKANPKDRYISVELRADRVAQTFCRCMLHLPKPIENVCCVGAECGTFLQCRIPDSSVDTIFVNHPEPPTQTYGAQSKENIEKLIQNGREPAHMLHSKTLRIIGKCLKAKGKGRLVIVTDNRWYARLICLTLQYVLSAKDSSLEPCFFDTLDSPIKVTESFLNPKNDPSLLPLLLLEGTPDETFGHFRVKRGHDSSKNESHNGSSYFDRLWQSGGGKHAEISKRFIIVARSCGGKNEPNNVINSMLNRRKFQYASQPTRMSKKSDARPSSSPNQENKSKNKKKSSAKQERRNKRRLEKKKLEMKASEEAS
eukprot:CAMPEP_0184859472 /NCGR_PEP_ID=MMETSP0580-20130426/4460_1 /TAXON_ID=1118495 /ORGANISM="Dactyliosolen fragilissimus" /LENGTH=994 /DNA_ID=CAMNT_0027356111 /DNA_START=159 /DNA_END=3143 /DNA_ORIENTATION=+